MRPRSTFRSLIVGLGCCLIAGPAGADTVREKVAIVDGEAVYHWRVFDPVRATSIRDDVDRALILREFRRRGYTLPERFTDEAVKLELARHYGGDRRKLLQALKAKGATLADFRLFLKEDLIIKALLVRATERPDKGQPRLTKEQYLAGLRKGARIERLKSP